MTEFRDDQYDYDHPNASTRKHRSANRYKPISATLEIFATGRSALKLTLSVKNVGQLRGKLLVDGVPVVEDSFSARPNDTKKAEWSTLITIPADCCDGKSHVFQFVGSLGRALILSNVAILAFPDYKCEIDKVEILGAHDLSIQGWCLRRDSSDPVELVIRHSERLIESSTQSLRRSDVQQIHELESGDDNHGFEIVVNRRQIQPYCKLVLSDTIENIDIAELTITSPHDAMFELQRKLRNELGSIASSLIAPVRQIVRELPLRPTFSVRKLSRVHKPVNNSVDVIVPIYGDLAKTTKCLRSILEAKCKTVYRLVIVNDGSPILAFDEMIDELASKHNHIVYIKNPNNEGFSNSANIGFTVAAGRDVILLNSDTVVQHGWIDKLVLAASSDEKIGTVTPLSNNGEIVSFPKIGETNLLPDIIAENIDRAATDANRESVVDIPVAVGFCMLITRACLNDVGLFDVGTWGLGYGEEVDFSLKATELGWRHVAAIDTFVYHFGEASFGSRKKDRIEAASRKISEMYVYFDDLVQRFLIDDPLKAARRSIFVHLLHNRLKKSTLHVTHSLGGGTEKYVTDAVWGASQRGDNSIVARFGPGGRAEVTLQLQRGVLPKGFETEYTVSYDAGDIPSLMNDLALLNPTLIHIHTPIHVPSAFLDWIVKSYGYQVTVHDYSWICPRVTLTQAAGQYCGEPTVKKCDGCVLTHLPHAGLKTHLDECDGSVRAYRERLVSLLNSADEVLVGSEDVRSRLLKYHVTSSIDVVEYPKAKPNSGSYPEKLLRRQLLPKEKHHVRVALIGGISAEKGFYKLLACAKDALERNLPITYFVIGMTMNDDLARSLSNIRVTGSYLDEHLPVFISTIQPHVSLFVGQCPETFCYTLSHAIENNIYPIAVDIGAVPERIRRAEFGQIVPYQSTPEFINDTILQVTSEIRSAELLE